MTERVMIFIDGSNVSKAGLKRGIQVDYTRIVTYLTGNRDNRRSYYFDAMKPTNPREYNPQIGFLDALRRAGITVHTKPLRTRQLDCYNCRLGKKLLETNKDAELPNTKLETAINQDYQKGVDIALVTELFRMAREGAYDTAIVVSGDDDFASAIDCVKAMGKRVELASFKASLGAEVKSVADKLIILDDIEDSLKREPKVYK